MVGPLFGKTYFPEVMLVLGKVYLAWHTQRFDKKIKTGHMEPLFFDLDINYTLRSCQKTLVHNYINYIMKVKFGFLS